MKTCVCRLRTPTDKFCQRNLDIVLEMCDTGKFCIIFFSLQSTATTSYIVITSDGGWIWTLAGFGGIKTFTECRNSLERHVSHETLNWHYFSGVWAMARVIRPHWRMPISINFGGKYNLGGCQVKFYCLLLSIYFFCHRCAAGKRLVWPYMPPLPPLMSFIFKVYVYLVLYAARFYLFPFTYAGFYMGIIY